MLLGNQQNMNLIYVSVNFAGTKEDFGQCLPFVKIMIDESVIRLYICEIDTVNLCVRPKEETDR